MSIDSPRRRKEQGSEMKANLSLATPSLRNQQKQDDASEETLHRSYDINIFKKRKWEPTGSHGDYCFMADNFKMRNASIGVDLHMKSPLPLDWEQCLDLDSGEMYYINRRTQERTCHDPRERLDLELKISSENSEAFDHIQEKQLHKGTGKYNEMFATACTQCHMFVMISKNSPSCPNCKYVHPLNQVSTSGKDKTVNVNL